jgi:hypothetical protein
MAPKVAGPLSRTNEKKSSPGLGFCVAVVAAPLGLLPVCSAQYVPSMAGLHGWAMASALTATTEMSAVSRIIGSAIVLQNVVIIRKSCHKNLLQAAIVESLRVMASRRMSESRGPAIDLHQYRGKRL